MHLLLRFALLLLTLFGLPARADDSKPAESTPETIEQLGTAINKILTDSKTPGVSLAVVDRSGVVFTGGFGVAHVAKATPVRADTLFRIGSTSKNFTALAALKLVREGRLDLNAKLADLAPDIAFENPWEATDPVRIVHLLEHTSGFDDIHLRDYANQDPRPNNLVAALAHDPDSRVSRWRPGTRVSYCNAGPAVVARVIERITGEVFEDYVQREWFDTIGMRSASYFRNDAHPGGLTELYREDAKTPYDYWHISMRPAGSINASAPIIHHPDVKRMLMTMRAYTEGCRAMASVAAAAYDASHHHPDADVRKQNQAFYEYLVPLVKGYSTEMSLEVTSLGVQVHGGMGFIEETGAAQYYRDAKILTIYEGTTAIQANDLVGRKTSRDGGQTAKGIATQIEATETELLQSGTPDALAVAKRLKAARLAFIDVVSFVAGNTKASPNAVFSGSVPYLMLAGNLMAGWQLARALLVAEQQIAAGNDVPFMQAKITTARFYADHLLSKAGGLRDSIVEGADSVTALPLEAF